MSAAENDYGDFLFVTLSRPANNARIFMTFYGLGYHEYRERWITQEWYWYQATATPEVLEKRIELGEALGQILTRIDEIKPRIRLNSQTAKGQFFETLAELTDEDFAMSELEDLSRTGIPPWLTDGDSDDEHE